jgi:bacitracin resistance protein BacA
VLRTLLLLLGIVQGLTEFLSILSSAHLSIVPRLLGYPAPDLAFDVLLHAWTGPRCPSTIGRMPVCQRCGEDNPSGPGSAWPARPH